MMSYFLLSRDCRQYNQMARNVDQLSLRNSRLQDRGPVNCAPLQVSDMLSGGAYHAINAVEKGWKRMSGFLGL